MNNVLRNTTWLTMGLARGLYNKSVVAPHFDGRYQREYGKDFAVGETIYPRLANRFVKAEQIGLALQPIVQRVTSITMNNFMQYSVDYNSVEEALQMPRPDRELIDQVVGPMGDQLAQDWDSYCALWATQNTSNVVGNLGTAISDLSVLRESTIRVKQLAGWRNMLGILSPGQAGQVVGLSQAIFNPQNQIGNQQYKKMQVGPYSGTDWVESMSLYQVLAGTAVTAITVTGANQAGSSLIVTGTAAQTLLQGNIIAIGSGATGMYAVNPATRRSTGALMNLRITQDATLTGGADTIQIGPAIIPPGSQYQNVDASPQDGAAVVLMPGTTTPSGKSGIAGLLFAGDAFARVSSRLSKPTAVEAADVREKNGFYVRMTITWDEVLSRKVLRYDSLGGAGNIEAENKSTLLVGSV